MQLKDNALLFSPTDLTQFVTNPFISWMDRHVIEFPASSPGRDDPDPMMESLKVKGFEHENNIISKFEEAGLVVVRVSGPSSASKQENTLNAMQSGADVIAQAYLSTLPFGGYADFLIREEGESSLGSYRYRVADAKLSKSPSPEYLVQLCCYADLLADIQGVLPAEIGLYMGDQSYLPYATKDYFSYFLAVRSEFLTFHKNFDHDQMPDPTIKSNRGHWSAYVENWVEQQDHLSQVATITRNQVKRLQAANVQSMSALANLDNDRIAGIQNEKLTWLISQAKLQVASKGNPKPEFEVIQSQPDSPTGLSLLPKHSPLDVYFDIEGNPLYEGGLEYLWGATYFDAQNERQFKEFWAHSHDEEKLAFEGFIKWVYSRWQQDPSMHVYHYANYEIAACRRLMGRYGICEHEVDTLLRNGVFVDLYLIVKSGIQVGEPRYSIKNIEHLYRGRRETDVGSGGESVVVYEQWRALNAAGEQGNSWQTSEILSNIRDYNIDDCNSTQELVVWLREQAQKHDIPALGSMPREEDSEPLQQDENNKLEQELLLRAEGEGDATARLTRLFAWLLQFHRREAKAVHWRMFDRMALSEVELLDDADCIAQCVRTDKAPFKPSERAKTLAYEYAFDPTQELKKLESSYYIYGLKKESGYYEEIGAIKEHSDTTHGIVALRSNEEPPSVLTLVPNEIVRPKPIPEAIEQVVNHYAANTTEHISSALLDFLNRSRPRIKEHAGGSLVTANDAADRLAEIIDLVERLDNSYLPIQGPPGAGKTYTAKHVIAALLKQGARIGISSNSHNAINNLLISSVSLCQSEGIAGSFCCTKNTSDQIEALGIEVTSNPKLAECVAASTVIGTTAWGFARDDMQGQLDYLFIDEAGQVSVANLVAMSASANNLVLLGDQMQLGQPSQGSHPEESGLSVLDYLLHDSPTISDDMGVFLNTTYRMHANINQFISTHVYEGKLSADPSTNERIVKPTGSPDDLIPLEAGILYVPVDHEGNNQASEEEADRIVELVKALMGRTATRTNKEGEPENYQVTLDDMLFVAPYNYQVVTLQRKLGEKARIGTVDKFQGQEAPIVFLSMCCSDASQSSRGVDFLFDRQRLNVAISRAQSLAIIVSHPELARTPVNSEAQLRKVNLFSALVQYEHIGETRSLDQAGNH